MRIVSLLPSATETLFALGLGDQVVAVTHECDFPPDAESLPIVTHSTLELEELDSAGIETAVSLAATEGRAPSMSLTPRPSGGWSRTWSWRRTCVGSAPSQPTRLQLT